MVLRNSGRVGSRRFQKNPPSYKGDWGVFLFYIPPELLPLIPVMRCCIRIFSASFVILLLSLQNKVGVK